MKTFSEALREAREAKGVTLEDLAASTKISLKILKALETGDFDVLPQTYVKGFLRTYASEVGLDAAAIVKAYDAQKKAVADVFLHPQRTERKSRRRFPWLCIGSLVGISVILFAGYYVLSTFVFEQRSSQGTTSEHTASELSLGDDTTRSDREASDTLLSEIPMDVSEKDTVAISHVQENGALQPLGPEPGQMIPLQRDTDDGLGASIGLTLRAEALLDTWVRVRADGVSVYEGIMEIASTATWEADSLFELSIGKAVGVRLLLNGQSLGDVGAPGQVVSELILDKNGIVKKRLR